MRAHLLIVLLIAFGLAMPVVAQDGGGDPPGIGDGAGGGDGTADGGDGDGDGNPPGGGDGNNPGAGGNGIDQVHEHVQQIQAIQSQIDTALANANEEFANLLAQDDLNFRQMRRLAQLRNLLANQVAPELVTQINEIKSQVDATGANVGAGDRPTLNRPTLTEEQQTQLQEHKDALQVKREELNDILIAADDTGRYAELLNDDDKTAEEKKELFQLRRTLIAASDDAKDKVHEIHDFNRDFRQEFRDLVGPPISARRHIRKIHQDVQVVKNLEGKINNILATSNTEFAELLAIEDKTDEDLARIAELKSELLENNDNDAVSKLRDAQELYSNIIRERRQRVNRRVGTILRDGTPQNSGDQADGTIPDTASEQ